MNTSIPLQGNSVGYRGIINIKTKRAGRVLASTTYHNEGLPPLFKGICNLLTGETDLAALQPQYLCLYTLTNINRTSPTLDWDTVCVIKDSDNSSNPNLVRATSFMALDSKFVTETSAGTKAIFQVDIPYTYISSDVYMMALLPAGAVQDINDGLAAEKKALACYRFSGSSTTGWVPLKIDPSNYDCSLAIEWQMEFTNKEN